MRWKEISEGEERVKSWFAILPVTIDGETRWLERVRVRQISRLHHSPHNSWMVWCTVGFVDDDDKPNP